MERVRNGGSSPLWDGKVEAIPPFPLSLIEERHLQFHLRSESNIDNGSTC
jgi:hypothetical protein